MDLLALRQAFRRADVSAREQDLLVNLTVENVGDYLVQQIEDQSYRIDYFNTYLESLLAKKQSPFQVVSELGILYRGLDKPRRGLKRVLDREIPGHASRVILEEAEALAWRCIEHRRTASLVFDYVNTGNDYIFSGKIGFKHPTLKFSMGPISTDPLATSYRGPSYVTTKSSDGAPPTRTTL